jgi:copper homeostasis protein
LSALRRKMIYEVIVCSPEDAIAAERGGANRLEIISHYEVGGLTPTFHLVREIVETVNIPARVMLRDDVPFVVTDEKKKERLCAAARSFRELPIEGVVLGFLKGRQPDHELVARVLACAPHLNATFHRAFEDLPDPMRAIAALKRHPRIDCILTSGGPGDWAGKRAQFEAWRRAAQPEIEILAGGGLDAAAIEGFRAATSIRAFHAGRAVREGQRIEGRVREDLVRDLAIRMQKDEGTR